MAHSVMVRERTVSHQTYNLSAVKHEDRLSAFQPAMICMGKKLCLVWLMFILGVTAKGVIGIDMHNINEAVSSEIRLSPK